jgi:Polysaccharide deacetylase
MRLAAMACALMVVMCVAVFGAILSQRPSISTASPAPAATATDGSVRAVITTLEERDAAPAPVAPLKPSVAVDVAPNAAPEASSAAPTAPVAPNAPAAPPSASVVPGAPGVSSAPVAPSPPTVLAQNSPAAAAAPAAPPAAAPPPPAAPMQQAAVPPTQGTSSCPGNPNALGISRVVEIDTTGGARFGFESPYDFLREGEVVLTFDDGPWPDRTQAVLKALAAHCTKAIFFPIGVHATYHPGLLKTVAAAGHAVGSHTWCHQNLAKTKGSCEFRGKKEAVEYDPKTRSRRGSAPCTGRSADRRRLISAFRN